MPPFTPKRGFGIDVAVAHLEDFLVRAFGRDGDVSNASGHPAGASNSRPAGASGVTVIQQLGGINEQDVEFVPVGGHAHDGLRGGTRVDHANLTNVTSDQHHPKLHHANHATGGIDAFLSTEVLEAAAKRMQESAGPTILTWGAVADGQYLKRSGVQLIGVASPATAAFGSRVVTVAPSGADYTTLSGALAAITTASISDPWLILVSGAIAETARVDGKSHVFVMFMPGSTVTANFTGSGQGFYLNTLTNTTWIALDSSRPTLIRTGNTVASAGNVLQVTSCDATVRLIGLVCDNQVTSTGTACHCVGFSASSCDVIECVFKTTGSTGANSWGATVATSSALTVRRCQFYGAGGSTTCHGLRVSTGASKFYNSDFTGGTAGTTTHGVYVDSQATAEFNDCRFFGGSGGATCHGVYAEIGAAPRLVRCLAEGGSGGSGCIGLQAVTASSPVCVDCTFIGGYGGTGCYGVQLSTAALMNAVRCAFLGGGVSRTALGTYSYAAATAKFQPSASAPYRVVGAYVVVNTATAGATVTLADAAAAGNAITGATSLAATGSQYIPITSAVLIAGAAYVYTQIAGGAPADASFTVNYVVEWSYGGATTTGSLALYNDSVARNRFSNCSFQSNCDSDAIYVTANGDDRSLWMGGVAAAGPRDVGTRKKAMNCAAAGFAAVYEMLLDGGTTNVTAGAGTANGSNTEI